VFWSTFQVTSPWVPPVLTNFDLPAIQDFGCDDLFCNGHVHGNATVTPAGSTWYMSTYFQSVSPSSGVVFGWDSDVTGGSADFSQNTLNWFYGGYTNGVFYQYSNFPGSALPPKDTDAQLIAVDIYDTNQLAHKLYNPALNVVHFTHGTSHVGAPNCTSVVFGMTNVITGTSGVLTTTTVSCADVNGIVFAYVIVRLTPSSGGQTADLLFSGTAGTFNVYVPPYISGVFDVVGVVAVNTLGNSVVYGTCGSDPSILSVIGTFCGQTSGGNGSTSDSPTLRIGAQVILAVMVALMLMIYA